MARLPNLLLSAAIAAAALTVSARPAYPQTTKAPATNTTDVAEEDTFHRLEELDAKRKKYLKSILPQEWQTAFTGWGDSEPRPQYLGRLFAHYEKLKTRKEKQLTIQWVETLANELVQRGDAEMFLLLAAHYVKYGYTGFYSPFSANRNSFGLDLPRLGGLMQRSIAKLSKADAELFRKDLGIAVASALVTTKPNENGFITTEPNNQFITAVLGYELLTQYAYDANALKALDDELKKGTFQPEDLQGLFTLEGAASLGHVAGGFMPNTPNGKSPLWHLFQLGLRVDQDAGISLRTMFMDAIKFNTVDNTFAAINRIYALAGEQSRAGMEDTMAQQMRSPVWEKAVGNLMTADTIKKILIQRYTNLALPSTQVFYIARQKQYAERSIPGMDKVYSDLLIATAKNPAGFYAVIKDFSYDDEFKKAYAQVGEGLQAKNLIAHFTHLANIYMVDANAGSTIDSNLTMMHLMRLDATLPPAQRVTSAAFRGAIMHLVKAAKTDSAKSYQLVKLVSTANNTGWDKHITAPFIATLRNQIVVLRGSFAEETLDSILRVQADRRALSQQWKDKAQIHRNIK